MEQEDNVIVLRPCPSCNGKARVRHKDANPLWGIPYEVERSAWVECTGCGLCTKDCLDDEEAAELWNKNE